MKLRTDILHNNKKEVIAKAEVVPGISKISSISNSSNLKEQLTLQNSGKSKAPKTHSDLFDNLLKNVCKQKY